MKGLKEVSLLEPIVGDCPEEQLILTWFGRKGDENKSTQQLGQGPRCKCATRAKALKKLKEQSALRASSRLSQPWFRDL